MKQLEYDENVNLKANIKQDKQPMGLACIASGLSIGIICYGGRDTDRTVGEDGG